uniref:C-type lectin domain-containing protein n=1 Tax=Pelusios castaneus TaxID=367368 RepID=A0A8C8VG93_9SAUR
MLVSLGCVRVFPLSTSTRDGSACSSLSMECAWVSRYLVHIICLVMFMQHLSSSCQLFMTYLCSAMPYTGPVPTTLAKSSSTCPMCPDGWVGYQRKCYYFSETEGNWSYCQSSCSSPDASLVWIDSEKEITFLLRHKGAHDHWIGFQREQGQPWKWTNGSKPEAWPLELKNLLP